MWRLVNQSGYQQDIEGNAVKALCFATVAASDMNTDMVLTNLNNPREDVYFIMVSDTEQGKLIQLRHLQDMEQSS